ncbi:phosphoribosylformylglycinamidine cyclo-ligase [Macrococcus equipercicus]|uniref:Phosphoribosylformylglycinamidine cyclo-ligase n=1 Tax=Macrococcus equipercicus TaxID=69967 RepID=A0A9Q9BRU6_9STAP|nr:phosphoribosylformylglycinamidine cyclo-ligase [Macrococcus equipercicus]KAA1042645.1 phosphoribosylformylglycinamidine cyclo-ligase [Macrococcus equipercicus]UTH14509.1 phosphoribosylformylglycinamidine cyclo-ligase [Macrococcus equipercicus]
MSEAYKASGVDIHAGYEAVERMKKHVARTMRPEVLGGLGGFGAAFDLSALNMTSPVLVSGTDGVGTKLRLAIDYSKHDTIGIDAVAMCVNDILTTGALPIYFLDYLALHSVDPVVVEQIVKGVADGCSQSECALIGGETAEMGEMYHPGDYDIAGFAVGAVEKSDYITGAAITAGDVIIGLPSSGIHSNGYSLVRKIIHDSTADLSQKFGDRTLLDVLIEPTRIYVKPVKALLAAHSIKGMCHITGGGFIENIPRVLPDKLAAVIDVTSYPCPPVFDWLQKEGGLDRAEMYNVFNMGIGFCIIAAHEESEAIIQSLNDAGEQAFVIGTIKEQQCPIELTGV